MADDNLPPLPKIRDDDYTDLLSKKGEKDYRPFFTPSESNSPIFDNEGASSMSKENAPENMKKTIALLDKLQDKFYKKHKSNCHMYKTMTNKGMFFSLSGSGILFCDIFICSKVMDFQSGVTLYKFFRKNKIRT